MGAAEKALTLALILTLKDEASRELNKVKDSLGTVKGAALAIGGAAVAGIGALTYGLYDAAKAAAEEEVGIARLAAAVRATGADWEAASAEIENYIAAEGRRVALDDGEGRNALARLTTTVGDYKRAMELLPLAIDLAAAKNIDLASAADIVGKVAMGNTGILTRYGIVLQEGATATDALAAMQAKFAGQGEAFAATFEGQQQRMNIALGNLKETVGAAVLPALTSFISTLADLATQAIPVVETALQGLTPILETVFGWVRDNVVPILTAVVQYAATNFPLFLDAIQPVLEAIWTTAQDVFGWFRDNIVPILTAIITFVADNWPQIEEEMRPVMLAIQELMNTVWPAIQTLIETVMTAIRNIVNTVMGLIRGDLESEHSIIRGVVGAAWEFIKATIENTLTIIRGIIQTITALIKGDWEGVWEGIRTILSGVWEQIKTIVELGLGVIKTAMAAAWPVIKATAQSGWDGIKGAIQGAWNAIKDSTTNALRNLKDKISDAWEDTKNKTLYWWDVMRTGVFGIVRSWWDDYLKGPMERIKSKMTGAWEEIKSAIESIFRGFNLHIPLPHFSISWEDIGFGIRIPHVSVNWYGFGGEFVARTPMLIGVGERGPERVIIQPLYGAAEARGGQAVQYILNYTAIRPEAGYKDAARAMRELELLARLRAKA